MPSAALIVNAGSRSGVEMADAAAKELASSGVEIGLNAAASGDQLPAEIKRAADQGFEPIIVGGGDGTQGIAASVLKGTGKTQAILPLGTGNALARDLGIPTDLKGACQVIATGSPITIDLGEANGRVFVNLCSLGLTAEIEANLNSEAKKKLGRAAYLGPVASALEKATPISVIVKHSGGFEAFSTLLVGCGPGRTQGGVLPLPGVAGHQTGKLAFYAVRSTDMAAYAELLWRLSQGTWMEMGTLFHLEAEEIEIQTDPVQKVVVDGEPAVETPLKLRCLPGALKVLVPSES